MLDDDTLKTTYVLEIYEPDDDSCVAAVFESKTPFISLSKGDYIHPGFFELSETKEILEVVSIEHIFWKIEDSHQTQKICIRTKIASSPFK